MGDNEFRINSSVIISNSNQSASIIGILYNQRAGEFLISQKYRLLFKDGSSTWLPLKDNTGNYNFTKPTQNSMSNKITLDKQYRYRNGGNARIIAIDVIRGDGKPNVYPVISINDEGIPSTHTSIGEFSETIKECGNDLIEYTPPAEVLIWFKQGGSPPVIAVEYGQPTDFLLKNNYKKIKVREVLDEDQP